MNMKIHTFNILALLLISHGYAYEMSGILKDESDGTFSVTIESRDGELEFYGNAYKQADGTLTITVNGQSDETYIGIANPTSTGDYQMMLRNNRSGKQVYGNLEVEQ